MEWLRQGCDGDLSADFLNFGAGNFPFKFLLENASKSSFFSLWRRDPVLELPALSDAVARSSIVFCNSVSADRIVMATSFAAESCESYMNGWIDR